MGAKIVWFLVFAALVGLVVVSLFLLSVTNNPVENKIVTGVFKGLSVHKSNVTLYFQNSTVNNGVMLPEYNITYYQSVDRGQSTQVPFIIGHTYQCIFGSSWGDIYPTLQTVVEIPT